MRKYDLAIIGSGPGGYVAGLYASRHKLKVCIIEKHDVGGTCLNKGCIPTKSLLDSASTISAIKGASAHGVEIEGWRIDFDRMIARKNEAVSRLKTGIETLLRANSIDLIRGTAKITPRRTLKVEGSDDIDAKYIIVACGSRTAKLDGIGIDEESVLSSDGILNIRSVPESLAIIGGGVIGCEFASLFNMLGSKVTIIEFMDRIVPTQSREVSKKLELIFKKRNVDIFTSSKAERITKKEALNIEISSGKEITAQKALVAVGRIPDTDGLGLEEAGIKTDRGRITVDKGLRTSVKDVYAIGDCVGGPLLAHKASYDGILACDNILGKARETDYSNIPNCIWTCPEIASVGLSEDEVKAKTADVKVAKFPYLASGKAYIMGKPEGFIKIVGDSGGKILGVEIFGEGACDLIGEAVAAKTLGINIRDWSRVVHGHPTLSEIIQEAAHIFCGTPIHSI